MVYILLAPGFEEMEALVPADLLRRAGIDTALVGTERGPVVGGHGIAVLPDMELPQVALEDAEMLVLPGGGRGVENLACCPQVEQLIRLAAAQGIPIAAICAATRSTPLLSLGASTRAAIALIHAAQANALLCGRDYIIPEDVQHLAPSVLCHRLSLSAEARMRGYTNEQAFAEVLSAVRIPVRLK